MIEQAWPALQRLGAVPDADPTAWRFEPNPVQRGRRRRFRAGKRARALRHQEGAAAPAGRGAAARGGDRLLLLRPADQPAGAGLPASRALRHRPSVQPAASGAAGRGGGRHAPPRAPPSTRRWRSIAPSASTRSRSARKCRAIWPTGCRRRCGARRCIWWPKGWPASPTWTPPSAKGPGLRWALMGPHATFHLAGGEGGMTHFLHHLLPAMQSWWDDLGTPDGHAGRCRPRWSRACARRCGGRSVAELCGAAGCVPDLAAGTAPADRERGESKARALPWTPHLKAGTLRNGF